MQNTHLPTTDRTRIPLNRTLGLITGTLLVAGCMIGSGVFKKIVPMSQTGLSETWIVMAWVFAGIVTMLGAFTLAGLSTITEESGGLYEYFRISFGNFFSFLFGWADFTINGAASIAAVAFVFAQTLNTLAPVPNLLPSLEHISIGDFIYPFADSGIKLLAILIIVLLTWVNYRGVQKGGVVNNIFTSAKILGILILIALGLFYQAPETRHLPVASIANELQGPAFMSAMLTAMLGAFWAYDGWVNLSFITGEMKNPRRNVPYAIIAGVSIAMLLYVLVNYAYLNVLSTAELAAVDKNSIGAAVVAETLVGRIGRTLIIVLIMVSVFGTVNALILAHTRVHFRMAQEKFFFKGVAKVHPTYKTPYQALLYTMVWSCILVISGTFDMLTDMIIFVIFIFYALLGVALLKMKREGKIKGPVIGYPVVPVILILFSLALLVNTLMVAPKQSLTGLGLVLIGVPLYLYFRKKYKENPIPEE
ncbi:MAG TPA: amino acid permease [Chitinophagaceae bacterium]|nr:amino acid permease [Chitinophagaceae bacterium]